MKKKNTLKFIMIYCMLFALLMITGCKGAGDADASESETRSLPYDYDEAVAKLDKYCSTFPTSLGSIGDLVFVSDVTGDGIDDLCTFIFFGSGMPRMDIVVYDVEKDKFHTLDGMNFRGAYGFNYRILSVEKYGVVISERQFYPEEYAPKFGLLTFEEDKLGMKEFDRESSEYEHAKETYEELNKDNVFQNY